MENVENKVIIITGATSGIGEATARVLAKHGAKVVLSGRREERLEKLANELGDSAIYLKSDVTNIEDMKAIVKLAKEKFGKVDVLFANAGIMPAGNMSELDLKGWIWLISTSKVSSIPCTLLFQNSISKILDISLLPHQEQERHWFQEMQSIVEQSILSK